MTVVTERTRRAGRPRDTRLDAAILAATVDLLAERGYHGLTLAAVAERAGTTTPAIYRRWAGKAELVVEAAFRTEGDDVVADTGDLGADLATMLRWTIEKAAHPAGRAALAGLLGEAPARRDGSRADDLRPIARATGRTVERLERAKASGELRADVDTGVLLTMMTGAAFQAAMTYPGAVPDDAWIASAVAILLTGITTTPTPAPPPRTGAAASTEGTRR